MQQRIKIEYLNSQGISKSDIARQVNIHPCTLSRELKRCLPNTYSANNADDHYRKKKQECGRNYVIDGTVKEQRFNRSYREDVLDAYMFESLHHLRELSSEWQDEYNECHPHPSLNNLSPNKYLEINT